MNRHQFGKNITKMHLTRSFRPGDLVWFDPGVGYVLPGEVVEFHRAAQVITVQAVINNVTKTFTLNNLSSVKSREDLGQNGVEDMITLGEFFWDVTKDTPSIGLT